MESSLMPMLPVAADPVGVVVVIVVIALSRLRSLSISVTWR